MTEKPMTAKQERMMLYRRGTKPCTLTPNAVYQTALSDIARKRHNAAARQERKERREKGLPTKTVDSCRPYAFCSPHVTKATSPADLIRRALDDLERGRSADDVNRRMIYEDETRLWAALDIATQAESVAA